MSRWPNHGATAVHRFFPAHPFSTSSVLQYSQNHMMGSCAQLAAATPHGRRRSSAFLGRNIPRTPPEKTHAAREHRCGSAPPVCIACHPPHRASLRLDFLPSFGHQPRAPVTHQLRPILRQPACGRQKQGHSRARWHANAQAIGLSAQHWSGHLHHSVGREAALPPPGSRSSSQGGEASSQGGPTWLSELHTSSNAPDWHANQRGPRPQESTESTATAFGVSNAAAITMAASLRLSSWSSHHKTRARN